MITTVAEWTTHEPRHLTVTMYRDLDLRWRFRVRYSNGKIVASSEAYSSRTKCRKSARALVDGMFAQLARIEEPAS